MMATGRSMYLTKQTGEYLVSAELCRRGLIATTFTGNAPEFDILAINKKGKTVSIQVKTIKASSWQFNARNFVNIEIENGVQRVTGKTKLPYPDLLAVFVRLIDQGQDEFYIFKWKDLQTIISRGYRRFLSKKEGIRPKNLESTHTAILPKDLNQFRDNWGLISKQSK